MSRPTPLHFLLALYAGWVNQHQLAVIDYLRAENAVLREHIPRKRLAFNDDQRMRLARAAHRVGRAILDSCATLATPDTLLRWYRELIARKYDGSAQRRPGRPAIAAELHARILAFASDNPSWGFSRIAGALCALGSPVSRSTIRRVLLAAGLPPDARRSPGMSWNRFLQALWSSIAAADFFTVEALTWHGLVRLHVLFVIELTTRTVHIAGVVAEPYGGWMQQIARNLLDASDGFLLGKSHLIIDRGTAFTAEFRDSLARAGVKPLRLPARSPNLNAYAERFVRSVRTECLDHLVIFGEAHLRAVLREYVEHYNTERPHQGIGNVLIRPPPEPANNNGPVKRRQRLGGLLSFYYRGAA